MSHLVALALLVPSLAHAHPGDDDEARGRAPASEPPPAPAPAGPAAPGADAPKADWKVDAPHGTVHDVKVDTTTGTWMSVDVHHGVVLFDLLGDVWTVPLAGGDARRLTSGVSWDAQPRWSPDGSHIVFVSDRGGNENLWIMNADGTGKRQVTTTGGVGRPSWSPDGSEIIYSSDERGGPQLCRISAAGGVGRLVPTGYGYCTEPSWSPDGKKIAFTVRQGGFAIAVMDLATGAARIVAEGQDPAWGADSRHIIYSDGSSIMLLDTLKGRRTPVVSGLGKVSEPSWSR